MTLKQWESLAEVLHGRRAVLARRLRMQRERVASGRHDLGDPVDLALEEIDRGTDELLMELERRELDRLVEAERLLFEGRLGVCRRCGADIDPRRLAVRPESALCVDCAAELEQKRTLH
jgi:DnaK suppressor protein